VRRYFHSKTYVNLSTSRVDLELMSNGHSNDRLEMYTSWCKFYYESTYTL